MEPNKLKWFLDKLCEETTNFDILGIGNRFDEWITQAPSGDDSREHATMQTKCHNETGIHFSIYLN